MTAIRQGDGVRPRPEWARHGVPSGMVEAVEERGGDVAVYVAGARQGYSGHAFEVVTPAPRIEPSSQASLFAEAAE